MLLLRKSGTPCKFVWGESGMTLIETVVTLARPEIRRMVKPVAKIATDMLMVSETSYIVSWQISK